MRVWDTSSVVVVTLIAVVLSAAMGVVGLFVSILIAAAVHGANSNVVQMAEESERLDRGEQVGAQLPVAQSRIEVAR